MEGGGGAGAVGCKGEAGCPFSPPLTQPSPAQPTTPSVHLFFGEVIAFTPVGDLARFNHSISSPGQLNQIGQINRGSTGGALARSPAPPSLSLSLAVPHFFSSPSPSYFVSSCLTSASTRGSLASLPGPGLSGRRKSFEAAAGIFTS